MKTKKSQGLPISAVAIAALVLGVVVVSFILLTLGSKKFSTTINDCGNNGGECLTGAQCETSTLDFQCEKGNICCAKRTGFV